MNYQNTLEELRNAINMDQDDVANMEEKIASLLNENISSVIGDLLLLLSDTYSYQELMWSVLHAAESDVESKHYVASFLSIISDLHRHSPQWATVVLVRILNSKNDRHSLVRQLSHADSSTKDDILSICQKINEAGTELLDKTTPVILACTH